MTEFEGVQSKLQSNLNYRSDNKRLETKLSVKKYKIKDFQECFSPNSFYYNILKDLCQNFGKKHLLFQFFKNSFLVFTIWAVFEGFLKLEP